MSNQQTPEDVAVDDAAASLLIELAFLIPRGTDLGATIGPKLLAYKKAIEARVLSNFGPLFVRDIARLVGLPDDASMDAIRDQVSLLQQARTEKDTK